jgi:hypothetical protein
MPPGPIDRRLRHQRFGHGGGNRCRAVLAEGDICHVDQAGDLHGLRRRGPGLPALTIPTGAIAVAEVELGIVPSAIVRGA